MSIPAVSPDGREFCVIAPPDDNPQDDIARLEAQIDRLRDEIEFCRKAIFLSRLTMLIGGAWIVGALIGALGSTIGFFLAVAAALGGIVGLGSNTTTRDEAKMELARLEDERNARIDRLQLLRRP